MWQILKRTLLFGLIFVLIGGLLFEPLFRLGHGLIRWLIFGLVLVLSIWLSSVLDASYSKRESTQRLQPNQGIRSSGRNGMRMGLIYTLLFGLIFGLTGGLIGGLTKGLIGGLYVVLIVGLIPGLIKHGGIAVIQHYTLRWLLARAGILPYPFRDGRLVAYLDAMHERIFLRRVGGGWIFVHRTLLEYFAGLAVPLSPS